jgi:DNA polymerase
MKAEATALLRTYLDQLRARGVTHVPLGGTVRGAAPEPQESPAPTKAEQLAKAAAEAERSAACRALGTLREVMVFATGNPDAEIMFVGEAPGAEEEKKREPFVGPAGQLLTRIINAMGLKRSDVYITNICKYRPAITDRPQGASNRAPTSLEMDTCLPFLTREIEIVRPRIIVALGATAMSGLGIEGGVTKLRGQMREFRGTPVMITFHPSYLLRSEMNADGGNAEKRLVWEDMLKVMEHCGIPVSAKQRAYFTKSAGA